MVLRVERTIIDLCAGKRSCPEEEVVLSGLGGQLQKTPTEGALSKLSFEGWAGAF